MEQIVIALGTAIISALTSYSLINWRLKQLEDKVLKLEEGYNKLYELSQNIALLQQDVAHIRELISK